MGMVGVRAAGGVREEPGGLVLVYAQLGDLLLVTAYWDELGGVHR